MSTEVFLESLSEQVDAHVEANFKEVTNLRQLNIDPRAAGKLFVNEDCIAVRKYNDRSLQYYGGFEYVDTDFRAEAGGYVFYFAADSRVQDHLDSYYSLDENAIENTEE